MKLWDRFMKIIGRHVPWTGIDETGTKVKGTVFIRGHWALSEMKDSIRSRYREATGYRLTQITFQGV